MKKKKQRGEKNNIPLKYAMQTEKKIQRVAIGAELEW